MIIPLIPGFPSHARSQVPPPILPANLGLGKEPPPRVPPAGGGPHAPPCVQPVPAPRFQGGCSEITRISSTLDPTACPLWNPYPLASPLYLLPHRACPAPLSASRSRYPAAMAPLSVLALSLEPPRVAGPPPAPPHLSSPSSGGRGLGRARAASAPLPRPGRPREEVPLSVSGEGRAGRPEGAAPRTRSGRELRGGGGGGGGGGGSGPYKRRGQGGREASVRPMCRPRGAGAGVEAAGAMRTSWAGGRRGAERSRLGA